VRQGVNGNATLSDLSGRLGMASAGDALGIGRLSVAWRYLAVPSSTNCCLGVAAGTLSYLELPNANTQAVVGCLQE
jgi:hypothetical protein